MMDHLELDKRLHLIVHEKDLPAGSVGSIISELQKFPILYAIAYWADRGGSLVIFQDPSHTISWNIAIRAKEGDPIAIEMCRALNLLSPDHCKWALDNEAMLRVVA